MTKPNPKDTYFSPAPARLQAQSLGGQVLYRNILCFCSQVLHEMPLDLLTAAGLDSVLQCKT